MAHRLHRGEEVRFEVTGAQHYGVLIRTDTGAEGWIEAEYLSEVRVLRQAWPPSGTRLCGVVLGYAADGRIRVCLRAVDGEQAQTTGPPPDR